MARMLPLLRNAGVFPKIFGCITLLCVVKYIFIKGETNTRPTQVLESCVPDVPHGGAEIFLLKGMN